MDTKTAGVGWLRSLSRFGARPGLDRTKRVLGAFGNPEEDLRFYHVAGTNGKGSVCANLTSILRYEGKVGTFTSPAFDGFRGRFMIDEEPIGVEEFESLSEELRQVCESLPEGDPLTEFEALTVLAILYFARNQVDHVVWETGLGGRFDSTNVVQPLVTAITNVSYDHMEVLGDTIAKIAYDKAGIIKTGVPIITAAEDSAYFVIEQVANEKRAPLLRFGAEFGCSRDALGMSQVMSYRGLALDIFGCHVPLLGSHQCLNTAIALAMYETAVEMRCARGLDPSEIREALKTVHWPGRFEVFVDSRGLPWILDGAHNAGGARALASTLEEFASSVGISSSSFTMVIGVLEDKDVIPMLDVVLPFAREVITCSPKSPRAASAQGLAELVTARRPGVKVTVAEGVKDACELAQRVEGPCCCWGSLYTVNEARKSMEEKRADFREWGR